MSSSSFLSYSLSWKAISKAEEYSAHKEGSGKLSMDQRWRSHNNVCCISTGSHLVFHWLLRGGTLIKVCVLSTRSSWSAILLLMWNQVWALESLRHYNGTLKWIWEGFFLALKLASNEWCSAVRGVDHRLTLPITRRFCNGLSESGPLSPSLMSNLILTSKWHREGTT